MTLTDWKRLIGKVTDRRMLCEISAAVREREKLLAQRDWDRRKSEAWAEVKDLTGGTVLFCNASGTFLGGPIQRGDSVTVHCVQPRKQIIWLRLDRDGKLYGFPPAELARYLFKTTKPPTQLDETSRQYADAAGKALAQSLG